MSMPLSAPEILALSRIAALEDALELPLLFHAGGDWDQAKRTRWRAITGTDEATTKVMCDTIRAVLAARPAPAGVGE